MPYELPDFDTMQDGARIMNEYYNSLVAEGFTPHQALHIVLGSPCCPLTHQENE